MPSLRQSSTRTMLTQFLLTLLLLHTQIHRITAAEDFYKLLGISRKATQKKSKRPTAEKFAEIAYAYEVLTDEEKKNIYDRHGEEGLKQHEQRQGQGGGHGGFDDIFSHFGFGGGFPGGGGGRQQREQSTPNINIPLRVSLKQLYLGDTIEVEYVRQTLCVNWQECMKANQECQGPGVKVRMQQIAPGFVQQTQSEKIDLTIDLQKGMYPGEPITFDGVADEKPGVNESGDLNFVITQEKHEYYHRDGDHLYVTMEIPLVDALTGFKHEFEHLDGTNS
ncbi:DnaJ C-terminal domain-containing protein [Skeletonema marinoi]|uniref:DnaJ C-terminal domain-containing protein n=1 Tax=Skeletonema marinoi TaxID=267567 RepID=A0AAD9DFG7_9STRA|nr:DnaJ C-terminal domain-containing protein [Skeletonema marinoi]